MKSLKWPIAYAAQTHEQWLLARQKKEQLIKQHAKTGKGCKDRLTAWVDRIEPILRYSGLLAWGRHQALQLRYQHQCLALPSLPKAFDGYRILQLSDLHIDALPGLEQHLCAFLQGIEVDLCVWTGDYRKRLFADAGSVLTSMQHIMAQVQSKDGHVLVFGNHESSDLLAGFEALGFQVLCNETMQLQRQGQTLLCTGVDDTLDFASAAIEQAVRQTPEQAKLLLTHAPDDWLAGLAVEHAYAAYLCGHTHGGQICLPNGRVVVSRAACSHAMARGLWQRGSMLGYTCSGIGVSRIPVRFFCPPELPVFQLCCV